MQIFGIKIDTTNQMIQCGEYSPAYENTKNQMGVSVIVCKVDEYEKCNMRLAHDVVIPANSYRIVEGEIFRYLPDSKVCLLEFEFGQRR